jgi:hypothetical protein
MSGDLARQTATEALHTRSVLDGGSPRDTKFALPHHDDPPPCRTQVAIVSPVACPIVPQLRHPPRTIRRRQRALRPADVPVPEAAVHEDDRAMTRQDDVGAAGKPADMEAKAHAVAMERGADQALGRGVMTADCGHHAGAVWGGWQEAGYGTRLQLG